MQHWIRRALTVTAAAALLFGAAHGANSDTATPTFSGQSVDTRLTLLETRLGRLELDVNRLGNVPTSLARIEEKITHLAERTTGQGAVISAVGLSIVMTAITGALAFGQGRRSATKE